MNDTDKKWYSEFLNRPDKKTVSTEDAIELLKIYERTFFIKIEPCNTCSGVYIAIINKLTKLYNYEN